MVTMELSNFFRDFSITSGSPPRCPPRDSVTADGVHRRAQAFALRWEGRHAELAATPAAPPACGRSAGGRRRVERDVLCDAADREADMSTNTAFVTDRAHGGLSVLR